MEERVKNVLLGIAEKADCFTIKYGWFKFRLKIRPLTAKQLILISAEVAKIKEVNKDQEMFPALMEGCTDLKYISKVIAIATGTRFIRLVSRAVLKLPLKDIQTLFLIVHKQSDPSPFFFIIAKTGRLNILKMTEEKAAEVRLSGEGSQ
jgi:hypothetical protein